MLRAVCGLALLLSLLVSPALAERKWFVRPTRAEQIHEMQGPHNSAEALRAPAERTTLVNDLPPIVPPKAPSPTSSAPPYSAVVSDILKIRRGTQPVDPTEEAEFADALRDVVADTKRPSPSPLPGDGDPAPIKLGKQANPISHELIANLHQSARQFDLVAANYEERGEFELADKSRQVAHSLRLEARGLVGAQVIPSLPQSKP